MERNRRGFVKAACTALVSHKTSNFYFDRVGVAIRKNSEEKMPVDLAIKVKTIV